MTTAFVINRLFREYGTPRIDRATHWRLARVNDDGIERREIENCPARLTELHDALIAGWELINDTQSLIGYAAPATTGAANAHSDHENEGNEDSHVSK